MWQDHVFARWFCKQPCDNCWCSFEIQTWGECVYYVRVCVAKVSAFVVACPSSIQLFRISLWTAQHWSVYNENVVDYAWRRCMGSCETMHYTVRSWNWQVLTLAKSLCETALIKQLLHVKQSLVLYVNKTWSNVKYGITSIKYYNVCYTLSVSQLN